MSFVPQIPSMFQHWGPGETNPPFLAETVVFCYASQLKNRKQNCEKIVSLTPAGTQVCCSFKEHDLITCDSKVQVIVSLGELWQVLFQSENVFELGGITNSVVEIWVIDRVWGQDCLILAKLLFGVTSYLTVIAAVAATVLAVAVTSDSGTSAVFSWCFSVC